MARALEKPKSQSSSDSGDRQSWQSPTVNKVSIKQITRGGMMFGSDMMGMGMMMMNGS